ncbi:AAA family ATPase [Bdellovibrionota bacterium FG-2]
MAHTRNRYLKALIQRGLTHKGIVGVFGHRQAGKTTLLELLAKRYTTLDRSLELSRANENPSEFLEELTRSPHQTPIAIDECQLSPGLFPELKEFVCIHKKPGLFLLSGSVRFSSRKVIRESLTGRILTYELLPFSVSELAEKPLNELALRLMSVDFRSCRFDSSTVKGLSANKEAQKYLDLGGLPGICFMRNERDRKDLIESQLNLIFDRDLRLVCETNLPLIRLRLLAQVLAENQNVPLNLTELARKTRISGPTLRKLLTGLEAIFFVRQVLTEGNEARSVYLLEDQGEASYLARNRYDSMADLERLAFAHLRIPFYYTPGLAFDLFQYRQQGGASVSFAFRQKEKVIGFICTLEQKPSLSSMRSARSFQKHYPGAKIVYLHPHKGVEIYSSDEASLPIELFL